jgi:hypothetical protein
MKKIFRIIAFTLTTILLITSCGTSQSSTTISSTTSLSGYKYIIIGNMNKDSDAELSDILLKVSNALSEKFIVVQSPQAISLAASGEKIISPRINVKTEEWGGGHTYITIVFCDYETGQDIAVMKSSGIGMTISHDQELAISAIKKELNKVFPDR